ncbi:MAG: hypothetical protein ABSG84_13740 [Acidobacteriaceae bacterium]|jgi:hypothetical protein
MDDLNSRLLQLRDEFNKSLFQLDSFATAMQQGLGHVVKTSKELSASFLAQSTGKAVKKVPGEKYVEVKLTDEQFALVGKVINSHLESLSTHDVTLLNMAFMYLMALFDAFTSDVFSTVLRSKPEMLRSSKKQLPYGLILELGAQDKIVNYMASRELNEVAYMNCTEQWEYFSERFGVDIRQSPVTIENLAEMNAQRNLLAHNRGIANQIYIESLKNPALKIGDVVKVSKDDWKTHLRTIRNLSDYAIIALQAKFCPKGGPKEIGGKDKSL